MRQTCAPNRGGGHVVVGDVKMWTASPAVPRVSYEGCSRGVTSRGIVVGAFSVAQGGEFIQGFAANALGAIGGRLGGDLFDGEGAGHVIGRTTVAAVAGGTGSAITGGKFANGAAAAAIGHLFNAENWIHRISRRHPLSIAFSDSSVLVHGAAADINHYLLIDDYTSLRFRTIAFISIIPDGPMNEAGYYVTFIAASSSPRGFNDRQMKFILESGRLIAPYRDKGLGKVGEKFNHAERGGWKFAVKNRLVPIGISSAGRNACSSRWGCAGTMRMMGYQRTMRTPDSFIRSRKWLLDLE